MASDKIIFSDEGEIITMTEDGVLVVPSHAKVMLIKGDNDDVWPSTQRVLDAAIEKAYLGERKITWFDGSGSADYPLTINLTKNTTSTSSMLFSGAMLLDRMGWVEASDMVIQAARDTIQTGIVPENPELLTMTDEVACSEFADVVIAHMDSDDEADQYDDLADKFHEEFEAGAENTAEFAHKAMETARKQLTSAGKFTEEQGQRLKAFLENDFSRVSQEMKAGAKEKLNPSRLGAGALSSMSKLLHKTGVALSSFADKADGALACKSGEITSAGKLKCNACSYEMHFKKTGRIPPCPKCHKTEFTKGY